MTLKSVKNLAAVVFIISGVLACTQSSKEHSQDDTQSGGSVSFKDSNLAGAFEQYALLRKALTETNFDQAKSSSVALLTQIKKVEGSENASTLTENLTNAEDISTQRSIFSDLSNEMLALVKDDITSGELYLAHCPMALDNTGAYWITQVNEIRNPYFGDKMMKCGVIKETLN